MLISSLGEDAVPEVLARAVAENDGGDGPSPLYTASTGAGDVLSLLIGYGVVPTDLIGPQLYRQCTPPLDELSRSCGTSLVGVGVCVSRGLLCHPSMREFTATLPASCADF